MSQKKKILKMQVSNYKQENILLYIYIVYYFTTVFSQQNIGSK